MRLTANLLLQHIAAVVEYQQTGNINVLFYAVNVSNVLLPFVDVFGELKTDKLCNSLAI